MRSRKAWKCKVCGSEFEHYRDVMEHIHRQHPEVWLGRPQDHVIFQGIDEGAWA